MAYSVRFGKAAKRQFDKLPRPAQERLADAIAQLASDPRPAGVVKLSGEDGLYRIRGGDYRANGKGQSEPLHRRAAGRAPDTGIPSSQPMLTDVNPPHRPPSRARRRVAGRFSTVRPRS